VQDRRLVTARRATSVLFLLNAVAYANVVPRLPAIKADLALSNTALGAAVAAVPIGALLSGPSAGWLVARFGSGRLATGCAVAFGLVLPGFALAPSWGTLALIFLVYGAFDSVMDVSMNAHALWVQRGWGRSIINRLHGLWSIGAVLGGLAGALAAGVDLALEIHLLLAGAAIIVAGLAASRWLLPGHDPGEPQPQTDGNDGSPRASRRHVVGRLAVLGLIVVMSAVIEDAPQSWGAVLLRTELGTSAAAAGLVYLAFQTMMTVSRLLGDHVVDRVGEVAVVRAGGVLAAVAVGVGLLIGTPASIVVAFAFAGLGTAPLFPLVFHAAGEMHGVPTGHGVAAVAWMGRIGFLIAPPLVGAIGDATNLRLGLAFVPIAGVVVALLAGALSPDPGVVVGAPALREG